MAHTTRFDITLDETAAPDASTLLVQLTSEGAHMLAVDGSCKPVLYRSVQFDRGSMEAGTALQEWLDDQQSWFAGWAKIVFVHQSIQAAVVPAALYSVENGRELLELQFGDLFRGTLLTEQVPGRQDYVLYRVHTDIYQLLSAAHEKVQHRHVFTLWLAWLDGQAAAPNGNVYLLFESDRVALALRRDEWLLVQFYEYQVPEDVSYMLLNALQEYGLSPEEVRVSLDGWIDRDSALYMELFKYVRNIETARIPAGTELDTTLLQKQPEHYFTPLIQMATCV